MPIHVEPMPGEPIIIMTLEPPLKLPDDQRAAHAEIQRLFDGQDGAIYRIIDTRAANLDFSHITMGMSETTRGDAGSASDPRFRTIIVGTGPVVDIMINGFKQEQYGNLEVPRFVSVEDALDYVRSETGLPA